MKMLMKQQSSRFKHDTWIKINGSRKNMLYKLRYDLLNRKDTESVYLPRTIDLKKKTDKNVLTFLRF